MRLRQWFIQVIPVVLFMVLATGVNVTYSYMKNKRDMDLIRIAFMNGAVEALNLDITKIKMIKNDKKLYQWAVTTSTERYVKKVSVLNNWEYSPEEAVASTAYRKIATR